MSTRSAFVLVGMTVTFCVAVAHAAEPLTTVRVASGLSSPVYVTHAPGDASRLFIVEQVGRIRILNLNPPSLLGGPFLDITSIVRTGGERGLLGMAFHPDFANNGLFYVDYTGFAGPNGDTVVAQYHVPPETPNDADELSAVVLMTIPQPQSNHNGGWIGFSPVDGYLYIATGDGGNAGDSGPGHTEPGGNSQDITSNLLGKMLRIDVNGDDFPGDAGKNYAIPPSNPFAGNVGDDEIWSYGLRNPWRSAFDSETGDLYIADVGQNVYEEIDFQSASSTGGENYGWRCREGLHPFDNVSSTCMALQPGDYVDPIHEYAHTDAGSPCSVSGGEVYRGCAVPNLQGTYFFADYCSNQIWSFRVSGEPPAVSELLNRTVELDPPGGQSITSISGFGTDAEGEIYICDLFGGEVFKIIPVNPAIPCSECGDNIREGLEECDGTDDGACPGDCAIDCTCAVPQAVEAGDDTCYDNSTDTGVACTTDADCPSGQECGSKMRYLAITPPPSVVAGPTPLAIQVTVTDMPEHPARVGEVWWASAPVSIPNAPDPALTGAGLECTASPHMEMWSGGTTVYLFGEIVIPESTYDIRMCESSVGPCSPPTSVATGKWGDIVAPFGGATQPNFGDISGVVRKFQGLMPSPSTARADLLPPVPDHVTNFVDINAAVLGFKGAVYPGTPPLCP